MTVRVKIGRDIATITRVVGDIMNISYKGKTATVDIGNDWVKKGGTLSDADIQKVKEAVGNQQ